MFFVEKNLDTCLTFTTKYIMVLSLPTISESSQKRVIICPLGIAVNAIGVPPLLDRKLVDLKGLEDTAVVAKIKKITSA